MNKDLWGEIDQGKLKGRKFLIPTTVLVENGTYMGQAKFSKACLVHEEFIPDNGCPKCKEETN